MSLSYDLSIHTNPDAAAWAKFFVETHPDTPHGEDVMTGWFANAMMAMHDHLTGQAPVVLPDGSAFFVTNTPQEKMMTEEMKPCAHCGGKAERWTVQRTKWVECRECGMRTGSYDDEVEAIAAWNRRTPAPGAAS